MKDNYVKPEIKVSRFDGEIGASNNIIDPSGGNIDDAKLSLEECENLMIRSYSTLQFN
ncbi:MAG: hypothetical protein ACI38A_06970 [Candidatus Ornithomonoglobus sp.]